MRILIVDDEVGIQETLSLLFEMHGFAVLTAKDGIEALEKISQNDIDFVLMDIKMPKMDGITAYYEIKKIPRRPLVILMTGYTEFMEVMREEGVEVLEKPVDVNKILSIIEKAAQRNGIKVETETGTI